MLIDSISRVPIFALPGDDLVVRRIPETFATLGSDLLCPLPLVSLFGFALGRPFLVVNSNAGAEFITKYD